jgi:hypothetical protein
MCATFSAQMHLKKTQSPRNTSPRDTSRTLQSPPLPTGILLFLYLMGDVSHGDCTILGANEAPAPRDTSPRSTSAAESYIGLMAASLPKLNARHSQPFSAMYFLGPRSPRSTLCPADGPPKDTWVPKNYMGPQEVHSSRRRSAPKNYIPPNATFQYASPRLQELHGCASRFNAPSQPTPCGS